MLYNTRPPQLARKKIILAVPALAIAMLSTAWQPRSIDISTEPTEEASRFTGVDQQPEFPGGTNALMEYLVKNVKYPEAARNAKVEGTVYVAFTITSAGKVTDAIVKRGVRPDLDDESLRVVRSMPDWKPGMTDGKAVNTTLTLPIGFRLGE
jgi:protein TonB